MNGKLKAIRLIWANRPIETITGATLRAPACALRSADSNFKEAGAWVAKISIINYGRSRWVEMGPTSERHTVGIFKERHTALGPPARKHGFVQ
jgi:hypothetical protein